HPGHGDLRKTRGGQSRRLRYRANARRNRRWHPRLLFYHQHFKVSDDADGKLACFCTAPNIRNIPQAFFCEVVGTFCLVLPIFLMTDVKFKWPLGTQQTDVVVGLGSLGLVPVAMLVFAIGLSLGGTTGYAINPARDLGPRIAHAV